MVFVQLGRLKPSQHYTFQHIIPTLFITTVPVALIGPLILLYHEQSTRLSSWKTLFGLQIPLTAMVTIQLWNQQSGIPVQTSSPKWTFLVSLSSVVASPYTLSRGYGYKLPAVLQVVTWIVVLAKFFNIMLPRSSTPPK